MNLTDIVHLLELDTVVEDDYNITGINTLKEAGAGEISFLSDSKYENDLGSTTASCCYFTCFKIPFITEECSSIVQ